MRSHPCPQTRLRTCQDAHLPATLSPSAPAQPVLSDLHTTFSVLRLCMRQHLEEEEAVGLPLLRAAFSAKELTVPEKKILKGLKPADMAWFVRRLVSGVCCYMAGG